MGINKGFLACDRTSKGDEVYTPFYAVDPIIKYVPKDFVIWLPFDEKWSAFYQTFVSLGYKVIRSCLSEGKDFFDYVPIEHYDVIISNPPFSIKDSVLKRLYLLNKPFMILLPITTLQGKERYKYFENGIQLLTFDSRIDYHTNGNFVSYTRGNHFGSAYFCRNILPKDLIIEKLTKYDKPLKKNNGQDNYNNNFDYCLFS